MASFQVHGNSQMNPIELQGSTTQENKNKQVMSHQAPILSFLKLSTKES